MSGTKMHNRQPAWFPAAPTLWVGNLGNEHMVDRLDQADSSEESSVQFAVLRLLWFLRKEDHALIPGRLDEEFLDYVSETRKAPLNSSQIFTIDASRVGESELRSRSVAAYIDRIRASGIRTAFPYIYDRSTVRLLARWGLLGALFDTPFLRAGGAESLNSKASFRLFADADNWPVPGGGACRTIIDFVETVQELFEVSERVIVKANMGVGGLGNLVLQASSNSRSGKHIGAPASVEASSREALVGIAERFGLHAQYASSGEVVIEEYVEDAKPVFAEYYVTGMDGLHPVCVMAGPIDSDPARGVLSGVTAVPGSGQWWMRPFLDAGARVAARLKTMGYRGLVNVDGILTQDGRCYLNEVNARMGGGTHIDVIARELIGANWNTEYTVSTCFGPCTSSLSTMRARLEAAGISWPGTTHGGEEGVVIVSSGGPGSPFVEYMTLARNTGTALEMSGLARVALFTADTADPGVSADWP